MTFPAAGDEEKFPATCSKAPGGLCYHLIKGQRAGQQRAATAAVPWGWELTHQCPARPGALGMLSWDRQDGRLQPSPSPLLAGTQAPPKGLRPHQTTSMVADPGRSPHGGCRCSPHQVPAPWGAGRQPCPRPTPGCPSAHWPGVGGGSRLSPTFPRADGMGSQHRWPCAAADWGRLPATRPGRAASPPRLGDKSEGREWGAEGAAGTAAGPRSAVPAVRGARPGTWALAPEPC